MGWLGGHALLVVGDRFYTEVCTYEMGRCRCKVGLFDVLPFDR